MTLYNYRNNAILSLLKSKGIKSVVDFGCGDGKLLKFLLENCNFDYIAGIEISDKRIRKIQNKFASSRKIQHIFHQSFFEYIPSFEQIDAIILSEIIEHLTNDDLTILFDLILNRYIPRILIITTPNRSYNVNFKILYNGLRHSSHLFELSDEDVAIFSNRMRCLYPRYCVSYNYCDPHEATHLIVLERGELEWGEKQEKSIVH